MRHAAVLTLLIFGCAHGPVSTGAGEQSRQTPPAAPPAASGASEPGAAPAAKDAKDAPKVPAAKTPTVPPAGAVASRPPLNPSATPSERARRLMDDALVAERGDGKVAPEELVKKFQAAAEAAPGPGPARFDLAVALDRAGLGAEAEKTYREVAAGKGELGFAAAERAAALAAARKDEGAARSAVQLAEEALPGELGPRVLRSEIELALGDAAAAAQAAARSALLLSSTDVHALCALARAHLAQGSPGTALVLAGRAAQGDAKDAEPLLVKAEIARASKDSAAELAAARAAAEVEPDSLKAALVLGRALFEHGLSGEAVDAFTHAVELEPSSFPAVLALGQALSSGGQLDDAKARFARAMALRPQAPEPHFELARLKLDGEQDAQGALEEAKRFLSMSKQAPAPSHPVHAFIKRCEEALKAKAQASVVQEQGK